MPDQDADKPVRARTPGPSGHTPGPKAPEPDEETAHLSEAARGVIRQSADPRLDAHLARMLSDTEAAPSRGAGHADLSAELERAREELAAAQSNAAAARAEAESARAKVETARIEADTARRRTTTLIWLLAAAAVAILILLVVVALR